MYSKFIQNKFSWIAFDGKAILPALVTYCAKDNAIENTRVITKQTVLVESIRERVVQTIKVVYEKHSAHMALSNSSLCVVFKTLLGRFLFSDSQSEVSEEGTLQSSFI